MLICSSLTKKSVHTFVVTNLHLWGRVWCGFHQGALAIPQSKDRMGMLDMLNCL